LFARSRLRAGILNPQQDLADLEEYLRDSIGRSSQANEVEQRDERQELLLSLVAEAAEEAESLAAFHRSA